MFGFSAKGSLKSSVGKLKLPAELTAVFRETGARTVLDVLCQIRAEDFSDSPKSDPCALHLNNRLTPEQRQTVLDAAARLCGVADPMSLARPHFLTSGHWRKKVAQYGTMLVIRDKKFRQRMMETLLSNSVFRLVDKEKGAEDFDFTPYEKQDALTRRTVESSITWSMLGYFPKPLGFHTDEDAGNGLVLFYRFNEHYGYHYTARMLESLGGTITADEIPGREAMAMEQFVFPGLFLSLAYPPLRALDQQEYVNLLKPPAFELDNPEWHLDVLRSLYPEQMSAWSEVPHGFYDLWVKAILQAVSYRRLEGADGQEIYLLARPDDDLALSRYAARIKQPLLAVRRYVAQVRSELESPELRSLMLQGCHYGSLCEWTLLRVLPPEQQLGFQYNELALDPDTEEKLGGLFLSCRVLCLGSALWPDQREDYEAAFIKLLGRRDFFGLRAYLYFIGMGDILEDTCGHFFQKDATFAVLLWPILAQVYGSDWMGQGLNANALLAGSTMLRRILFGFESVEGYAPSKSNFCLVLGIASLRLRPEAVRVWADHLGVPMPDDIQGTFEQICSVIAPRAMSAVREGLHSKARNKKQLAALERKLLSMFF